MKRSLGDAYILESIEKIISIILKEKGFQGVQPQALEVFSNILNNYLDKMFSSAHSFAELGNRAKPNIHDITRSFEFSGVEMSDFKEFLANVQYNQDHHVNSYLNSTSMKSTVESIPEFLPSDNEDSDEDMEDNNVENGIPTYVPKHLPTFPSKHSFRQTPIYINRPDDPQKVRELNSEQSRTVEENLKKLMAAENELLKQANDNVSSLTSSSSNSSSIMMPIVNYEVFIQRRKRQKQSGTTLNVENTAETSIVDVNSSTDLKENESISTPNNNNKAADS